ncbi:MAG TPA: hypothetical protein VJA66_03900 [Thermoanaerobaculia bacterium]
MAPIAFFSILLAFSSPESAASDLPWQDLTIRISADPGISSDHATICRVRVENHGSRTWSGRRLVFEAEALEAGQVVERARGRFGLTLGARETLETVIGFNGRFREFRVRLLAKESLETSTRIGGSRSKGSSRRKRRSR